MASSGARCCSSARSSTGGTTVSGSTAAARPSEARGTLVLSEQETLERPLVTAVTHSTDEARVTLTGVRDEPGVAGRIFGALADANINVDMIIQNEPVSHDGGADLSFTVEPDDLESAVEAIRLEDSEIGIETRRGDRQGLDRRRRDAQPSGRRRQGLPRPRRERDQHRDDLHLADQDLLRDPRRPRARGGRGAPRRVRARGRRDPQGGSDRRSIARRFPSYRPSRPVLFGACPDRRIPGRSRRCHRRRRLDDPRGARRAEVPGRPRCGRSPRRARPAARSPSPAASSRSRS